MGQTVRDKDTNADGRVAKRTRILSKQPPPSRSAASKEQDGLAGVKEELLSQLRAHVIEQDYAAAAAVQRKLSEIAVQETPSAVSPKNSKSRKRPGEDHQPPEISRQAKLRTLARPFRNMDSAETAGHGPSKAGWSSASATGLASLTATGSTVTSATSGRAACAERFEEVDEDEERRQAELRHAQDQLKKCLAGEDYTGAAVVQGIIAALKSAEHRSQGIRGRLKAGRSAASPAGHKPQPAAGSTIPSADLVAGAAARRFEKADDDDEEKRQAQLRRAQDELKKCLADNDFQGAADAQGDIAALMSAGHGLGLATGPVAPSATGARGAASMRVVEVGEENDERQL